MWEKMRDERGFVLILVIMLLAAMTAIGAAALMTSNTDMLIARNEKESKIAFYLAETGLEEAVGRMDLGNTNTRFIGETQAQRTARVGADRQPNTPDDTPNFDGSVNSTFDSTSLNLSGLKGEYEVTVTYAREGTGTWCSTDDGCNNEIVMYGTDFGFSGTGVPTTGYVPVYQIDSVGTTSTGTIAQVRAYMTSSSLNVVPPAGDLFSNQSIDVQGAAADLNGAISAPSVGTGDCVAPDCNSVAFPGVADMETYLGIDLDELAAHADSPSPHSQTSNHTYQEANDGDWGDACSDNDDTTNITEHICSNDAKIIYIDNDSPATSNAARIPGGSGRGILVITGDLNLSGNLVWEGMVYIMGNLSGNGSITCFGTMMVNQTVNFNGSANVAGSVEVAQSVADMAGMSRMLRWTRM